MTEIKAKEQALKQNIELHVQKASNLSDNHHASAVTKGQEMPPKISRMIINYGEPRCKGWGSLTVTAGKKILQGRMSEWEIRVWF